MPERLRNNGAMAAKWRCATVLRVDLVLKHQR